MPKYKVRNGEFIQHDGKDYAAGSVLTCSEEQAKLLRVDPLDEKAPTTKATDDGVTVEIAAARIAEMNDAKEIRRYVKGDERKGVNDAAEARIEELKAQ